MKTIELTAPERAAKPLSSIRRAIRFLRDATQVAWKSQATPTGRVWGIIFLSATLFPTFEVIMGAVQFSHRTSPSPLIILPVVYLLLTIEADIYILGHFAKTYAWQERVVFQARLWNKIERRGVRRFFSTLSTCITLIACEAVIYLGRFGVFVFLTQEDMPPLYGRVMLYLGTAIRAALTYWGMKTIFHLI